MTAAMKLQLAALRETMRSLPPVAQVPKINEARDLLASLKNSEQALLSERRYGH